MLKIGLSGVLQPAAGSAVIFMQGLEDMFPCQVLLEIGSEGIVPGLRPLPSCVVLVGLGLDVACGLMVEDESIPGLEFSVEFEVVVVVAVVIVVVGGGGVATAVVEIVPII